MSIFITDDKNDDTFNKLVQSYLFKFICFNYVLVNDRCIAKKIMFYVSYDYYLLLRSDLI